MIQVETQINFTPSLVTASDALELSVPGYAAILHSLLQRYFGHRSEQRTIGAGRSGHLVVCVLPFAGMKKGPENEWRTDGLGTRKVRDLDGSAVAA